MALQQRDRLHGLVVRVGQDADANRVVGMHLERLREVFDDQTQEVVSTTLLPSEPITFAGLAGYIHPDDRAALLAALTQ